MFDPRVQAKGGQSAQDLRRVWSAENVKIAIDAYEQGLPLITTPFITGQVELRRPNLIYDWTDHELKEAIKCKEDIVYFAETYCQLYRSDGTYGPIKLFEYQKKILRAFQNNRYLIMLASRQMGKTTTTAICLLWVLLFGSFEKIALLGDKFATAAENIQKIKDIYIRLPFFLKPGVVGWNKSSIAFDNGNLIFGGPCNLATIVGRTISILYFDELAIPDDSQSRPVVEFAFPTISALQKSKIIISSSPRGDNIFKELWLGAAAGTNKFHPIRIDWWERPGRDEVWKQEQIGILGSERAFEQQYGNRFLTTGTSWLSEESSDYMDELIANSSYVFAKELTDDNISISKLTKVEPAILKSKYVNKSTIVPKTRLVDKLQFDSIKIPNLSKLKDTPLLITIDSGEGRGNDSTIVNFFVPEFDSDRQKLLDEALSDIELEATKAQPNAYEDVSDALTDDDIDIDSLDSDFIIANSVRCRQIGILSSNEHCMPMIALFVQIFIKCFCNEEKIKIICELDGCGSLMQQYLAIDIVKNSGLDQEIFGIVDSKKKSPGIYMRGKAKVKFVETTESLISDSRILCSYAVTVFEMRKFGEVKPGKWQGIGCHDDHTMSVVQLGGYMTSEDFLMFVEDLTDAEEDNDDIYSAA